MRLGRQRRATETGLSGKTLHTTVLVSALRDRYLRNHLSAVIVREACPRGGGGRTTQYSAASRFMPERLRLLGLPPSRGMTSRGFVISLPPEVSRLSLRSNGATPLTTARLSAALAELQAKCSASS